MGKKNKRNRNNKKSKHYKVLCPICKQGEIFFCRQYMGDYYYEVRSNGQTVTKKELKDFYDDLEEWQLSCSNCEFTQDYPDEEQLQKDVLRLAQTPGYLKTPGNRREPGQVCLFSEISDAPPPQWAKLLKRAYDEKETGSRIAVSSM
jgi:hypothetical protein